MGTKKWLELRKKFDQIMKLNYYILKCDISKFFASINVNIQIFHTNFLGEYQAFRLIFFYLYSKIDICKLKGVYN